MIAQSRRVRRLFGDTHGLGPAQAASVAEGLRALGTLASPLDIYVARRNSVKMYLAPLRGIGTPTRHTHVHFGSISFLTLHEENAENARN